MALGFTTADLANLKAALVSGALRVQIGDRLIIYRSQKEIVEAIRICQAELNGLDMTILPSKINAGFRKVPCDENDND